MTLDTLLQSSMLNTDLNWILVFLAAVPIVLLIVLMGVLKMSGDKSAVITLVATAIIGTFAYNLPLADTGLSIIYGILKAFFPIIIIIVMAIFSYNVLVHTGKMEIIKEQFSSISSEKPIQVLLLTWGFGGLLEGMAGFGTAVAIPAAILISLGFKPIFSAVVSLVANSVPTAFGAVGIPVITLADQAGLTDVQTLSSQVIIQLSPLMIIIPFVLMYLTDSSMRALPKNIFLSILVGLVSLIIQYISAVYMGAETPAIFGSIAAILTILVYAKLTKTEADIELAKKFPKRKFSEILGAWSVYGIILVLIIATSPLFINKPMVESVLGTAFEFNIFNAGAGADITQRVKVSLIDAGILLFIGSIAGGLIQGAKLSELLKLLGKVTMQQYKTMITVCSLIALSSIMDFSGMVSDLGLALAVTTGAFYPLFAPTIGCLGTFLTGSDTSSNIIFGKLQAKVAATTGADTSWLSAANTTGATGGKIISPQSIAVATSACNLQGQEGVIMKKALPFALAYIVIAGLVVYFFPIIFGSVTIF